MTLTPQVSLAFDGRCEAAFRFYERCLGGANASFVRWGGSPLAASAPPDWAGKVLHGSIALGDVEIVGADPLPGNYAPPRGFALLLNMTDAGEAERVFEALSEGGTVELPLQQTFWAARFGILTDQFGIPWQINCA